MKFFVGYDDKQHQTGDIVSATNGDELLNPITGGYRSFDGPFETKHAAYVARDVAGPHVTQIEAGCDECDDEAEDRFGR